MKECMLQLANVLGALAALILSSTLLVISYVKGAGLYSPASIGCGVSMIIFLLIFAAELRDMRKAADKL